MTEVGTARRLSRRTSIALLVAFLLPLVLAPLLYMFRDSLPLPGPRTHGELVQPVRPLEGFEARTLDGEPLGTEQLQGKWTLIYVGSADCSLDCQAALFKMRQARLALGAEDMGRVQRLYLIPGGPQAPGGALRGILEEHPGLMAAAMAGPAAERYFGPQARGVIFMVDPMGNVMMRYGEDATSKGILKDFKRLLKYSRIG